MLKPQNCIFLICLFSFFNGFSQFSSRQYFDGADTNSYNSIQITIDTAKSNIWQIGKPHKKIFDSAATAPNAILTDTHNFYPKSNHSSFSFYPSGFGSVGIMAIQWKQKLDMDKQHAGGFVEFSTDGGATWQNAFNSPYVYKFYGYDSANVDSMTNFGKCFTGTDTIWKDIWLCFDNSYLSRVRGAIFKVSFNSDSTAARKEGWMLDNMLAHLTIIHTAIPGETEQKEYLRIYPTPTNGIINIQGQRLDQYHIIENMELMNAIGQVVERYGFAPTKFYIDIKNHPDGVYYLKITTNIKTQTFPVILRR